MKLLKTIVKVLFWIQSSFLFLMSIVGVFSNKGETGTLIVSGILFALAVLFNPLFLSKVKKEYKIIHEETKEKNRVKKQKELEEIEKREKYNITLHSIKIVQGQIYQLLESMYLSYTSSNPDVVIGRLDFIFKKKNDTDPLLKNMVNVYSWNSLEYSAMFTQMYEEYKVNYYDKVYDETMLGYVMNPLKLKEDRYNLCDTLVRDSMDRFFNKQLSDIESLKTKRGKVNRLKKNIEKLESLYVPEYSTIFYEYIEKFEIEIEKFEDKKLEATK